MINVLLAAPLGNVAGGIASWTNHIMQYYGSLRNPPIQLKLFDIARSRFISIDIQLLPRLYHAVNDYTAILYRFHRTLQKEHIDVLHLTSSASFGLLHDLYMLRKARQKGIKTVVHFRFGRIPELYASQNWEWKLLTQVMQAADLCIVLEHESYDTLIRAGFENVCQLPNPLAPRVSELTKDGTIRVANTILFIGHCIRSKGVFELVKACRNIPNVQVRMVGFIPDDIRSELMTLAGHESWLKCLGERPYEEVIHEMQTCEVFVLPSYTEGFPNVILEAMACGCSIVATDVGSIPNMLEEDEDGLYGIVIPPRDVNALHAAIERMMDDENLRQQCGENARRRVHERYSMAHIWKQMVNIWESLN